MNDDELWQHVQIPKITGKGVFIVNEGNFMYQNASLSLYDAENQIVYPSIFNAVNGIPLGDVAQSASLHNGLLYIVVNNSGKIYVIDSETFEYKAKITGLTSPRYIHFVSDKKAYISDLYSKTISILDVENQTVVGHISVENHNSKFYQHSTEQFVRFENTVFVNCWNYDNKILVINTLTDKVADSITVPKQPQSMVLDRFENLWVLCDGGLPGSAFGFETPALCKINARSRKIERTIKFSNDSKVSELCLNSTKDTLFFLNRDVMRLPVLSENSPEIFFKNPYNSLEIGGLYGLGISPVNSEVYVGDGADFVQNGRVFRLNSKGTAIDTFNVGIIPGSFCFK